MTNDNRAPRHVAKGGSTKKPLPQMPTEEVIGSIPHGRDGSNSSRRKATLDSKRTKEVHIEIMRNPLEFVTFRHYRTKN